jgi:two-component system sensor histidine kinase YesM
MRLRGKADGRRPGLKIRHKIILSIYLVLFPVLILAEIFIYTRNVRTTMEENTRRYQAQVDALNVNLSYMEQDVEDMSLYFCVNDSITRVLESPGGAAVSDPLFWTNRTEIAFAKDILAIKDHIRTLILYPENGLAPFYVSKDASAHSRNIGLVRTLPIYDAAVRAQGDIVWGRLGTGVSGLFENNRTEKILICREIFDLSKHRKLAFLAITMDVADYEKMSLRALMHDGEAILILNGDGEEFVRVGKVDPEVLEHIRKDHPLAPPAGQTMLRYDDWYVFTASHGNANETIYYLTPVALWDSWIRSGLELPILLAVALLVSTWLLSWLASRLISRPLSTLYRSMNRFKEGDFTQEVKVTGRDEIAELSDTFNTMVRDIKDLIDRNYVMVLREKESELNALQAQINPHFLYNALDSLYWQALDSGQEKLAEDVLSLSELFRLTLSSGEGEIEVRQEIAIVSHYLHIQKMRFEKKLDYVIDVPEEMRGYILSKLVLQPFVENAIVHGLENRDEWGFVRVAGRLSDGIMTFTIEDNGAGMTQAQVDEILYGQEDLRYARARVGHYAIRNVKERLKLRYGDQYELSIQSRPGAGTTITIKVPAVAARG